MYLGSDWDDRPKKKKTPSKKKSPAVKKEAKTSNKRKSTSTADKSKTPKKKPKKEEVEQPKWEWWKEDPEEKAKREEAGIKWQSLEHMGPFFPPDYEPLPKNVMIKYKGKPMRLEESTEEVMTFYAGMLRTDYVTDPKKSEVFNSRVTKTYTFFICI